MILRKVPILSHAPENVLYGVIAAAAILVLFGVFIVVFMITDFVKVEKEEHKAPDAHKLIMDLQHNLIQEMKGTSKQNALMINLTIIFILITVIGMLISITGSQGVVKLWNSATSWVPNAAGYLKGLTGR